MNKYSNLYKRSVTKDLAREIKRLRATCTYRMVATRLGERHPELKIIKGNQLEGIELCNAAQECLKEKWK